MEQTWFDNARLIQILASVGQYNDLVNGICFSILFILHLYIYKYELNSIFYA